jgi:hypothetical protein
VQGARESGSDDESNGDGDKEVGGDGQMVEWSDSRAWRKDGRRLRELDRHPRVFILLGVRRSVVVVVW